MKNISTIRNTIIKHGALEAFIKNSISYNNTENVLRRFGGHFNWSMPGGDWGAIYQELIKKNLYDTKFTVLDLRRISKTKTLKD